MAPDARGSMARAMRKARVGKNKAVEFNGYCTNHIFNIDFNFKPAGDHGGVHIMLGLFGYDIELHFYDTRHWNYETNTWEKYDGH